ncbi:hypothetical protein [Halorubrum trueperi]|uniref:Domain of unknown function domain-containing protein n=1 Tax=Halorubrum trueperi TaxID=2004704 RepID=A0ABD5UQK9_9EURY
MDSSSERERGVLSTKDRNYLRDGAGIAPKSSAERVTRSRIRKRLYSAYLDFKLLNNELEERDRKTVFEDLPDDRDLHRGITAALEFTYLALKEQNLDFKDYLEEAIANAEEKLARKESENRVEVDVELNVETRLVLDEARDISEYSDEEIGELLMNGEIDGKLAAHLLQERHSDGEGRDIA